MKKRKLGAALILATVLGLVACGETTTDTADTNTGDTTSINNDSSSTTLPDSPYTLKITAIGSTTISVSKTVQLRSSVTGTSEKNVTWSSLDTSIATVSDKGVVTGVGAGIVTIKAVLNIDSNCFNTIQITVEGAKAPETVTITGYTDSVGWVNEDKQLSVTTAPEDAVSTVSWSSTDTSIATVSEGGLVSFIKSGDVSILATSTVNEDIYDQVDFEVKAGVFYTNIGSKRFDYSHQADATNPYIELSSAKAEDSAGFNSAYFNGVLSEKFYAETTFQGSILTTNAWDWQGIGIGSGLSDSDARFFTFSPHNPGAANTFNKTILRDRPETWGALTNRSQIWGEHGLNAIDYTQKNTVALLRNNNEYYYLLNGEVFWYDVNEKYDGVATMPFLVGYDMPVKFTEFSATTDSNEIDTILDTAPYNKSFYAANDSVTYVDDSDFTFNSLSTLSKDHKVRSIGDKAKLVRDFDIEFDVDSITINMDKDCHRGVTINLSRYDNADVVDTVSLGYSTNQDEGNRIIGKFTRWQYPQSFENKNGIEDWYETTTEVKADKEVKSHVKITRRITGEKAVFKLYVDNVEYNFDLGKNGTVTEAKSVYIGAYLIWVAGEYSTFHISNFVFRSNI